MRLGAPSVPSPPRGNTKIAFPVAALVATYSAPGLPSPVAREKDGGRGPGAPRESTHAQSAARARAGSGIFKDVLMAGWAPHGKGGKASGAGAGAPPRATAPPELG